MKFKDLLIGDKFVHGYEGFDTNIYEKKSLSSAWVLNPETLERTFRPGYAHEYNGHTFAGMSGACTVHPLAVNKQ